MPILSRKKNDAMTGEQIVRTLRTACNKRILAKVSTRTLSIEGRFLELTRSSILLDNTLTGLDEVRLLRNRALELFFPIRHKLLRGKVRLTGLATVHNIRALRFSIPEKLEVDEKRGVRRIYHIPEGSTVTFSNESFDFFHGHIRDASPTGLAIHLDEEPEDGKLTIGERFQGEVNLGEQLKLSFEMELRHEEKQGRERRIGVRILKLGSQAQERLNEWLFRTSRLEEEAVRAEGADEDPPVGEEATPTKRRTPVEKGRGILVIAPPEVDTEIWYQSLGRKYEVITCDDNMANIRDALNVSPALILIYLDSKNPDKASFMRKFCAKLGNRPLMFFGEEPDPERRTALTGSVNHLGFLDISERKLLHKFRMVDQAMQSMGAG